MIQEYSDTPFCKDAISAFVKAESSAKKDGGYLLTKLIWDGANLSPCDFCSHGNGSIICPDFAKMLMPKISGVE